MSSRWLRAQEPLTLTTAMVMVAVAQLLPLAALGFEVTSSAGEASRLLSSGALWSLLLATVARSCLITLLAVALGLPLGFLLGRTNVGARRLAFALHAFPLFLPPFLLALGWFQVFGREGYLGTEATSALLFGEAGVAMVLTLALAPVVTTLVVLGLDGIDESLEDAGRTVASPWRVATRISLPLIWPNVALGALVVFALALAELDPRRKEGEPWRRGGVRGH